MLKYVLEASHMHSNAGYAHLQRDWYGIAEAPAPAPRLAHPEGFAALRIVVVTVPRVSRCCENLSDGLDLHLLPPPEASRGRG